MSIIYASKLHPRQMYRVIFICISIFFVSIPFTVSRYLFIELQIEFDEKGIIVSI